MATKRRIATTVWVRPFTSLDFANALRNQALPKTAYDFTYWTETVQGIKNWAAVNPGKMPVSALGVGNPDPYTLTITTDAPRSSIDPDPAVTLRNLEEQITPHTRLIVCSHVSSMTGIQVPGPGIRALAKRLNQPGRERPILTLIDGTQEVGQWLVDVPAIGCDYYVSNGHKWLGGPKGSGFLVASPAACAHLTPPYMAGGILDHGDSIEDMINHRDAPHLFESATQNLAVVSVLADAVAWLDNLGWSWIEARERSLAAYLRGNPREVRGLTLLTPDAWELSSAITSFVIEGTDAAVLQKTLWNQRIITRLVGERNGIRIATPYFTSHDELDQLVEALIGIRA